MINTESVRRVAFVTHAALPEMTADDRLAADVLESRGVPVVPAVWDDPAVDWSGFECVVIRSTWDYHTRPQAYADWLRRLDASGRNVWNPPGVVGANLNKRYLAELERSGAPVVPTEFLAAAGGHRLRDVLLRRRWREAVVKPAVSLGAHGTWRTSLDSADVDQERFERQAAGQDLLVQSWVPEVASHGEWSLVFIDGHYSHAVLKRPGPGDFRVQPHLGGHVAVATPRQNLVDHATGILAGVEASVLYARVDSVESGGRFLLMELELNEPNLFLGFSPAAAMRLAAAIEARF